MLIGYITGIISSRLKEDYSFCLSKTAYKLKNSDLLTIDFFDNKNVYPLTQMQIWKILLVVFPLSQLVTRQYFWSCWMNIGHFGSSGSFGIMWFMVSHILQTFVSSCPWEKIVLLLSPFCEDPSIYLNFIENALEHWNFVYFLGVFSSHRQFPPLIYLLLKTNKSIIFKGTKPHKRILLK